MKYYVKFNRDNNRFEIIDLLTDNVVLWYMNASIAFMKVLTLNGSK